MSTHATLAATPRTAKRINTNPASAGLPDPRPVTDYDAEYTEVGGKSRITITLRQPCVIRVPVWSYIDSQTGEGVVPSSVTVTGNKTFVAEFPGIIPMSVNFVDAPYQDMQVQNFQGGFVRSGGKWFRAPK